MSNKSLFPILLCHEQESVGVYDAFIKYIQDSGGLKDGVFSILGHRTVISEALLSCDAKAASLIFGAKAARSATDFCPYRCVLNKDTYLNECVTKRLDFLLPDNLIYVVCVLHLRIRLMGHVFEFIRDIINAVSSAERRRSLYDSFVAELKRCRCPTSFVCLDGKGTIGTYDPTGDAVDKLTSWCFSSTNILSAHAHFDMIYPQVDVLF